MPNPPRPSISVGRGVKVYDRPGPQQDGDFRQDATCEDINNNSGICDARTVKTNKLFRNLPYRNDQNEGEAYWTELPEGYVPGSEGH